MDYTADTKNASKAVVVTRRYLFNKMQSYNLSSIDNKFNLLRETLISNKNYTPIEINTLKNELAQFKFQMKLRWTKSNRDQNIFFLYNEKWLEENFPVHIYITAKKIGRPKKSFANSSARSQRRKIAEVRSVIEKEIILQAAHSEVFKAGDRNAAEIIKQVSSNSTCAATYKSAILEHTNIKMIPLSPIQALSMFVDADLTRRQYEIISQISKPFFPCYTTLQKLKRECYPSPQFCIVNGTSAENNLQALVNLTINRLSIHIENKLSELNDSERFNLNIICKWGCDGSQQNQFKQKFENEGDSDKHLFQSCFVPLRIVCGINDKIIWENPTPSSPRFCRPIRFRFVKETTDVIKDEIEFINNSIKNLSKTEITLNGLKCSYAHTFMMTMVDGKVCNAATDTKSTSKCYLCGETSNDFNKLNFKKEISLKAAEFSLSVLHARIRLFESIIHLAYKLPVKKYKVRKTEDERNLENLKKNEIQDRFRKETGLLIDIPKTNFGNTNDGNTSRRFFENPKLASEITGIDFNFIYKIKIILEALSSGYNIDPIKYDEYAKETAFLYIKLYSWHPMSPTLHKILVHGAQVIENLLLPIGELSEEAAEGQNKFFRKYRQNFSRKFSRENCNQDIVNRLLLRSDPLLSCTRRMTKHREKELSPEAIMLLKNYTFV